MKSKAKVEQPYSNDGRIATFLAILAETTFGVALPEQVALDLIVVGQACELVDDEVDNTTNAYLRSVTVKAIVSYLLSQLPVPDIANRELLNMLEQLRTVIQRLSTEQGADFFHHVNTFFLITEEARYETSPQRLSTLRLIEGEIIARVYLDIMSDAIRAQAGFQDFVDTFVRMGRIANALDTLYDLRYDYRQGVTRVRPSFFNRLVFLRAAGYESLSLIPKLRFPTVVGILAFERRQFHKRSGEQRHTAKPRLPMRTTGPE